MNALVMAELGPRAGDRVLEIGFGGGALLAALLEAGARPAGADVSEAMVGRARRRFRGRVEIARASIEALPFGDGAFDKAASVNNIYFWPDPGAGMRELARVVRPGGRLAIAFEPPEELARWPGHRHGFRLVSLDEATALMEEAGFGGFRTAWGRGRKPDRFCCLTATRRGGEAG